MDTDRELDTALRRVLQPDADRVDRLIAASLTASRGRHRWGYRLLTFGLAAGAFIVAALLVHRPANLPGPVEAPTRVLILDSQAGEAEDSHLIVIVYGGDLP